MRRFEATRDRPEGGMREAGGAIDLASGARDARGRFISEAKPAESTDATREAWLNALAGRLRARFVEVGAALPDAVRLSCGWPSKGATSSKNRRIGECWSQHCSADGTREVFISPTLADPVEVAGVVVHELVHAAGYMGHGADFAKVARALGLTGRMTATVPGDALVAELTALTAELGPYPHATLTPGENERKQTTRLLKVQCPDEDCGYTVRVTAMWLEIGFPSCPCGEVMARADVRVPTGEGV